MILQDKLPEYVSAVVERRLDRSGFAVHDIVTILVVVERLIGDEGNLLLEDAYYLKGRDSTVALARGDFQDTILTYMLIYGFQAKRRNRTDLINTIGKVVRGCHKEGWPSGIYGLAEMNAELELVTQENPFVDRSVFGAGKGYDFDMAVRVTNRASRNYGEWKTHEECADLQQALKALDREGTGRVRLLDFYKKGNVSGNWFLEEQQDYLRDMGAPDESNSAIRPQVIIPNYVQAPSNCLKVSSLYEVCCLRRCETILGRIEREIHHPSAEPVEILKVVQELIDDRAGIFETPLES